MANLHLQDSLSTTGTRNFKKLVVYAKVKVLRDHEYQRTELDYRIDIQSDTKKRELLKNPTKIEEIQEKKFIDRN